MRRTKGVGIALTAGLLLVGLASSGRAQNSIILGTAELEYPSYQTLSIKLPITGDDNRNAVVDVRYRVAGSSLWSNALPLLRVMPETVMVGVPPHFAGSIFDLRPGTRYQVELTIIDPDGGGATRALTGDTRRLPVSLPAKPRYMYTNPNPTGATPPFGWLIGNAEPGDVITLAEGVYNVQEFWMGKSGTPENPVIVRGVDRDKVILDGGNCSACIMFALRNMGHVIFEDLTIRNIGRAFRIITDGTDFVFRRIRTTNVDSPVYSSANPTRVTVMDCVMDGPSTWPSNWETDPGRFNNYNGIALGGSGHVIAHNRLQGFGDAIKFMSVGNRGQNVYGNDIYDSFDNAIELDLTSGNSMAYRNRITNSFIPLSVQPVIGGPAYLFRNVMHNVYFETIKYHAVYGNNYSQPSGVLAYHNTSVNTKYVPLGVETGDPTHNFQIKNNIFLGLATSRYSLSWGTAVNHGVFDYNLYFPDAEFWWRDKTWQNRNYPNLAALKAAPNEVMEKNGMTGTPSATLGLAIPRWDERQNPNNLNLRIGSPAVDKAQRLPNINDGYLGTGPDVGAHESGCESPWYGPRPKEMTEANQLRGCERSPLGRSGTARLARTDTATRGNWKGRYGTLGKLIAGDPRTPKVEWTAVKYNPPGTTNGVEWAPVTFNAPGTTSTNPLINTTVSVNGKLDLWQSRSQDGDALQWSASTDRSAAAWTTGQDLIVDIRLPGTEQKEVALYFAEFGTLTGSPRKLEISVVDNMNRLMTNVLHNDLTNGTYLVFHLSGHVKIRIVDHSAGSSGALLNGIFFGNP